MQKHRERIDLMARKDKRGRNLREGESQRKDGLYMYRYTDRKSGKRTAIYDADLAALREKEWKIAQDMDAGIVTERAAKKMTVNTLFERYMESKKLADSTRGNYISTWNNRVRDEIGMMKVVQVRSSHVKLFYAQLTKEGYSHSMVKLIHNLLYPSFEMAVGDDIIRKNPAKDALGDNGKPAKEKAALTPSQQDRLLSFVAGSSVYGVYLPMLQVMIGTGCRCGELIGLTWPDVDMEKREVSINCQLIYKDYGDGYRFHVSAPKTDAGIRTIPMSDTVYQAFAAQKRQNFLQGIPRNAEIEGRTDFIFMSKNGRPLMPGAVNNVLYNIVAAYNRQEAARAEKESRDAEWMPPISAHTLRHTGCTRMAEQGLDMKVVQYVMGHASVGVTMEVYNHITEKARVENEIAKMDAVKIV